MPATGTFTITLKPIEPYTNGGEGISLGRYSIDKTFEGDLEATSQGEMLSARTPDQGSAGYVALEQVVGSLEGRNGSFVLQHYGRLDRGSGSLVLQVVPDSGTGDLEGIRGNMVINVEEGVHHFQFDYELG